MSVFAASNWSLVVFVVGVVLLCLFMLTVPLLLGGKTWGRDKHKPFESGVVGVGGARMRFSAKFYLVAIFFVLFDIEALFLYAWSVSVRESGWAGFVEVTIFIAVLMVGLIYIWRIGALSWSPNDLGALNKNRLKLSKSSLNLADATAFIPMEILELDPTGKVPAQQSGKMNASNPAALTATSTTGSVKD